MHSNDDTVDGGRQEITCGWVGSEEEERKEAIVHELR